jgi:type IV pilus assembly protein PilA
MLHQLRRSGRDDQGFTLIELLVVILIIGILAAIALPALLNQRGKAQDTEAKTQVRTMQTAEESFYTDTQDYTAGDLVALQRIEPSLKDGRSVPKVNLTGADSYEIQSTSPSGNVFTITKVAGGSVSRTCSQNGVYGCPTDGSW